MLKNLASFMKDCNSMLNCDHRMPCIAHTFYLTFQNGIKQCDTEFDYLEIIHIIWPISQIILSRISFLFLKIKFIHYYSYVMFAMNLMSIYND